MAEEVARCLGGDELLLVHAPTGTGKTLAYLLPALMWARRYGVRVGIATYTRALQSQAMEREVPRAFAASRARGASRPDFKVSILKGREHSLCWRALRAHAPGGGRPRDLARVDVPHALRPARRGGRPRPLPAQTARGSGRAGCVPHGPREDARARARAQRLLHRAGDRACAAETARARAQRSHVVLTNQSFALARPEFFRRIVFDECEHLHDQAMSAWSHRVTFGGIRRVLARLHEPGARGGGPPEAAARPPRRWSARAGSGLAERVRGARTLWSMTSSALASLESEVLEYERWRSSAAARPRRRGALRVVPRVRPPLRAGPRAWSRRASPRAAR